MFNFAVFALTTFISVNGQLMEVPTDSEIYNSYIENQVTDIGNPLNLVTEEVTESESQSGSESELTATPEPTVEPTAEPSVVVVDNEEEVELLTTAVELLAENSDTVTGTVNSTVLTLMDRMIDSYPSFYKYAGFRTSDDDSYASTLYISKSAKVEGDTITFGEDCVAVDFARQVTNNYTGYIYYNVIESPSASVNVNSGTIVYTNIMKGYPSLGSKSFFSEHWIWVAVFILFASLLFNRRNKND